MSTTHVNPDEVVISDVNERDSSPDVDDLVESIEQKGVIEGLEPVVRETDTDDAKFEAYIGQRRVVAAQKVGLEEIPVTVSERGDEEAIKASIIENVGLFSESVKPSDRANALSDLWSLMGEEGFPSSTTLSDELNVPESTVRTWLEPLRDEWEGTEVDPTSGDDDTVESGDVAPSDEPDADDPTDDEEVNSDPVEFTEDREPDGPDADIHGGRIGEEIGMQEALADEDTDEASTDTTDEEATVSEQSADVQSRSDESGEQNIVDELGENKLRDVRVMTGGGEDGEEIARRIAEEGLTNKQVEEVKKLYDRGNKIDEALEKVRQKPDEETVTETVKLPQALFDDVEQLADEQGETEGEIIRAAVEHYVADNE